MNFSLLLTVPFAFTAEQIGPAFPETFKDEILRIRKNQGAAMRERARDLFVPIASDQYLPRLTVLEKRAVRPDICCGGLQADLILDVVSDVFKKTRSATGCGAECL